LTDNEFISALSERGIKAELNDGIVMMLLSEKEMRTSKKYARIVSEIGWKRSWGRKAVKD
jgi:hypothetical protein